MGDGKTAARDGRDPARAEHDRDVAEAELLEIRTALANAQVGLWVWDLRSNRVRFSTEWKRQLGSANHELGDAFSEWESRLHPDDHDRMLRTVRAFVATPWPSYHVEFRLRQKDDSYRWVLAQASLTRDDKGRPAQMVGSYIDITDNKATEQALAEREQQLARSEEHLRIVTDAVPHMIFQVDPEGRMTYANKRWRDYFGPDARWTTLAERIQQVHPDDRAQVQNRRTESTDTASPTGSYDIRCRGADGVYRWFAGRAVHLRDEHGKLLGTIGTATEVDALKKSQDALHGAQARLQAALRAGGIGTSVWEVGGRSVWDESLLAMMGLTPAEIEDREFHESLAYMHPDDRAPMRRAVEEAMARGTDFEMECRLLRGNGSAFWAAVKGHFERDATGRPVRLISAVVDITSRKRLEGELLQSQKLEAIGQLAGGVAHDFNNLLTVILGQASLIEQKRDVSAWAREAAHEITAAGERASALTAQLLAFGRRQVMQPRDLDLNVAIGEALKMLTRVLGDDVELAFEGCEGGAFGRADPNMLTQVLVNLAVNARDAMPRGGRVAVRTSVEVVEKVAGVEGPVPAGRWACLSVSDTGSGIDPEVLPHVFEPFFTTKGVGKGTGLGLSTVYGIAKQHGGSVTVDTIPGKGTTFRVYVPASEPRAASARPPTPLIPAGGGVETILLVEDDLGVRSMLVKLLGALGYDVLAAEDGAAALRIWKARGPEIGLVLTDMLMPGGLSGERLVELLRGERPDLKVILSSGQGVDAVSERLSTRVTFLEKPYDASRLLQTVRRTLDGA